MTHNTVTEREEKALVTIETVERLAIRAQSAIEAGNYEEAQLFLGILTDETTQRTCTAVKDQTLSDRISHAANNNVAVALLRVRRALASITARGTETETEQ